MNMKWRASPEFEEGNHWVLRGDNGVFGRVFRANPSYPVDVALFNGPYPYCHSQFPTMKEAAEWLVKKVTNGTGAV